MAVLGKQVPHGALGIALGIVVKSTLTAESGDTAPLPPVGLQAGGTPSTSSSGRDSVNGFACPAREGVDAMRQQRLEGIREGKVKDNSRFENLDAGADFQEAETDRIELSAGKLCRRQKGGTECMHENVGGTVEEKAKLIGLELVTTGAIRLEVSLMLLDHQFDGASGTVDLFVQQFGASGDIGDHVPWIDTAARGLGPEDDPARVTPSPGRIEKGRVPPDVSSAKRKAFLGLSQCGLRPLLQHTILGQSHDVEDALRVQPIKDLWLACPRPGAKWESPRKRNFVFGQASLSCITTRFKTDMTSWVVGVLPGRNTAVISFPDRPS
jgi:hypothetical protein